jgi:hypothetical protein
VPAGAGAGVGNGDGGRLRFPVREFKGVSPVVQDELF